MLIAGDNEKKLIQISTNDYKGEFICPHCKFEGIYNKDIHDKYLQDMRRSKGKGIHIGTI